MSEKILDIIKNKILLTDGAAGTRLLAAGIKAGHELAGVNINHPEMVLDVHRSYIEAGADIITTNSFAANPVFLERLHLENKADDINRRAAVLARQAIDKSGRDIYLGGSIGPTGHTFKKGDLIDTAALGESFFRQAKALADKIDIFLLESFSGPEEIGPAVDAVRRAGNKPMAVMVSVNEDLTTIFGYTIDEIARYLDSLPADLIGFNCSDSPDAVLSAIKTLAPVTDKSLIAVPSAGLPLDDCGRLIYPVSPDDFVKTGEKLMASGVRIIGGCCGTTPAYIKKLRDMLDRVG